jgi:hypothetical protein
LPLSWCCSTSFREENLWNKGNFNPVRLKERRSKMKANTLIGIILIVVGIVAFAYQGITYTTREKVVDIGSLHMTAERTKTLPLPPIASALALVGGIVLLVMGTRKS